MTQHVQTKRSDIMSELNQTDSTKFALGWPCSKPAEFIFDTGCGWSRFLLAVECAWDRVVLVDVAADSKTFEGANPCSQPRAVHRSLSFSDRVFYEKPVNHGPRPSELRSA